MILYVLVDGDVDPYFLQSVPLLVKTVLDFKNLAEATLAKGRKLFKRSLVPPLLEIGGERVGQGRFNHGLKKPFRGLASLREVKMLTIEDRVIIKNLFHFHNLHMRRI